METEKKGTKPFNKQLSCYQHDVIIQNNNVSWFVAKYKINISIILNEIRYFCFFTVGKYKVLRLIMHLYWNKTIFWILCYISEYMLFMTKIYICTSEYKSSWCFNAFNPFVCFKEANRILLLSTLKSFKQNTSRHIYICLISSRYCTGLGSYCRCVIQWRNCL